MNTTALVIGYFVITFWGAALTFYAASRLEDVILRWRANRAARSAADVFALAATVSDPRPVLRGLPPAGEQ